MKFKTTALFLIGIFIALLAPLTMGLLMHLINFPFIEGSNDGWLGFWGGYLGAIFSISAGMYISFREAKKSAEESQKASIRESVRLRKNIELQAEKERENQAWFIYKESLLQENKNMLISLATIKNCINKFDRTQFIDQKQYVRDVNIYYSNVYAELDALRAIIDTFYEETMIESRYDVLQEALYNFQDYILQRGERITQFKLNGEIMSMNDAFINLKSIIEVSSMNILSEMKKRAKIKEANYKKQTQHK